MGTIFLHTSDHRNYPGGHMERDVQRKTKARVWPRMGHRGMCYVNSSDNESELTSKLSQGSCYFVFYLGGGGGEGGTSWGTPG